MTKRTIKATAMKAKGKQHAALAALSPVAREINEKLEIAQKNEEKAFDMRLSAALLFAQAKKTCEKNRINFRAWSSDNVKVGWETVRKMATVGAAKDPKVALIEYRARAARVMRKVRTVAKSRAVVTTAAKASRGGQGRVKGAAPAPVADALTVLKSERDNARQSAAETLAATVGKVVADKALVARARAFDVNASDAIVAEFGKIASLADRRTLVERLARKCDGRVVWSEARGNAGEETTDDLLEIPASLRRTAKPRARKGKANA